MAYLINLKTYTDDRGSLTAIDEDIPFEIKRIFYIYGVDNVKRGGHRHKTTRQAAVCLQGSCTIFNHDGKNATKFVLDTPDKCLVLEPFDWHLMDEFTPDAILMVIASEKYDTADYIFEPYDRV